MHRRESTVVNSAEKGDEGGRGYAGFGSEGDAGPHPRPRRPRRRRPAAHERGRREQGRRDDPVLRDIRPRRRRRRARLELLPRRAAMRALRLRSAAAAVRVRRRRRRRAVHHAIRGRIPRRVRRHRGGIRQAPRLRFRVLLPKRRRGLDVPGSERQSRHGELGGGAGDAPRDRPVPARGDTGHAPGRADGAGRSRRARGVRVRRRTGC